MNQNKNENLCFFDAHAHINMIEEKRLKEILENAKKNNVKKIISCSTSYESNKKNLVLSKQFSEIKSAIGLYPLNAIELNEKELEKAFSFFKKNIKQAIAIGEIGLDYKYSKKNSDQEKQIRIFEDFIKLGKKNKPLIIHSRYAQRKVLEILETNEAEKVILHGFVESKKLMKRAFENNYFISVGPILLENEQIQENIVESPIEKILFETDSPIKFNQKDVFSQEILKIVEKTAELKNIKIQQIAKSQKKNFKHLFSVKL
jgi:TatD DNase family protein